MRPSSIRYYFKEGFVGLLKNRLMSIASIGTVAACIFIVSLSVCLISNISSVLHQIEDTIGVVVFLEDDVDAQTVNDIRDKITSLDHVTMVTYISAEEALEGLKEEWSAEDILEGFTGENNPLTASFEIDLDEIENQGTVLAALEKIDGIRNIRHSQAETEILIKLNNGITVVGVTVICILAVISIIIIMNTIKISVYTRRTEIGIMKFVGATDWFIRWPFIIEGVLIGVIGSALPMAISWPLYSKMVELIYTNFPVIKNIATLLDTYSIFARLSPIALVFGTVMGIVGSVTSIKKYLKV